MTFNASESNTKLTVLYDVSAIKVDGAVKKFPIPFYFFPDNEDSVKTEIRDTAGNILPSSDYSADVFVAGNNRSVQIKDADLISIGAASVRIYRDTPEGQPVTFDNQFAEGKEVNKAVDLTAQKNEENSFSIRRSLKLNIENAYPGNGVVLADADLPPLTKGFHQIPVVTYHKANALDPTKSNKLEFGWSSLNDSDTASAQFQELVDEAEAAQKAAEVALARVQDLATSFEHGPTTGLPNKQHPSYTENTLSFELERDSTVAAGGVINTATYVIKNHTKWPRLAEDVGFISALRHPQLTISSDVGEESVLEFLLNSPYLNANIKQIRLEATNISGPNSKVARLVAGRGASFVRVVPSNANYEGQWLAFKFKVDKAALRVAGTLLPADLIAHIPAIDKGDISGLGLKLRFDISLYSEDDVNYPDSSGLNFVRAVTDRTLAAGLSWLVPFGNVANLSRRVVDVGRPWLVPFASVANLSKGIDDTAGDPNAIISGQTRPDSEEPDFFEYENSIGGLWKLIIRASNANPLKLRVAGEPQLDLVANSTIQLTNHEKAPAEEPNARFTAANGTGEILQGETDVVAGTHNDFHHGLITMADAGSLITNKIGKYATFFNSDNNINKYIFGLVESSTRLTNCIHGYISQSTTNLAGGDNYDPYASLLAINSSWYIKTTLWVIYERTIAPVPPATEGSGIFRVIKNGPTYGATLPTTGTSAGDWWVRTIDNTWHEMNAGNTEWVEKRVVHLGWIVVDLTGTIIGARCAPFSRRYSNENNCQIERVSNDVFRTTQPRWRTNVNGHLFEYKHEVTWDKTIPAHVEAGVLSSDKWVGLYIKDDGEPIIGDIGFFDRLTKSFRHRKESWRQLGKAWLDSSSNFSLGDNLFPHQKYLSDAGGIPTVFHASITAAAAVTSDGPVNWISSVSTSGSNQFNITTTAGLFDFPAGFDWIGTVITQSSDTRAAGFRLNVGNTIAVHTRNISALRAAFHAFKIFIFMHGKQERQIDLDNTLRP